MLFPKKTGTILAGKTIFTALAILAAGLAAVYLPVCRDNLWPDKLPSRLEFEVSTWLKPGIVILSIFIILCFFLSYGMQDLAASVAWLGGDDYLAYTRIFMRSHLRPLWQACSDVKLFWPVVPRPVVHGLGLQRHPSFYRFLLCSGGRRLFFRRYPGDFNQLAIIKRLPWFALSAWFCRWCLNRRE